MLRSFLIVLALVGISACSSTANVQYLPIGTRCTGSSQCGTSPYFCREANYPGGYCEKPCDGDGDCPSDSICNVEVSACRRKCTIDTQCRESEGYSCRSEAGVTTTFCELTTATLSTDAGTK